MKQVLFFLVLTAAAVCDRKDDRIPNELCLFTGILGVLYSVLEEGAEAALWRILLGLILFVLFVPLWLLGVLGAGDIKLIMAAACFLGEEVIPFLICSGCCSAFLSLFLMIRRRNFLNRIQIFLFYIRCSMMAGKVLFYPFDRKRDKETGGFRVSYGFLAGYVMALAVEWVSL